MTQQRQAQQISPNITEHIQALLENAKWIDGGENCALAQIGDYYVTITRREFCGSSTGSSNPVYGRTSKNGRSATITKTCTNGDSLNWSQTISRTVKSKPALTALD